MAEGNVRKFVKDKGYESIHRNMLQDVENLSLESIGLLAHLRSYSETWKIHKTELYKRFAKSKRTKVETAWNELVQEKYIVQLRKRTGKKYEYIYYHNHERFTEEDIKNIVEAEQAELWDGKVKKEKKSVTQTEKERNNTEESKEKSSNVDFQQSKLNSSKSADKKFTKDEVYYKDNLLDTLDTRDTKTTQIKNSSLFLEEFSEEERLREKELYMQKAFYENSDKVPEQLAKMLKVFSTSPEQANEYYQVILSAKKNVEISTGYMLWLEHEPELTHEIIQTFSRSIRKIEKERNIDNPKGYLYTAIHEQLQREVNQRVILQNAGNRKNAVPFYNWLED
ncbi:MAG: hypothetical protein ACQEWW_26335 [Bacillota bacterium]